MAREPCVCDVFSVTVTEQRESGRLTSLSDPLPPPQLSLVTVETGKPDFWHAHRQLSLGQLWKMIYTDTHTHTCTYMYFWLWISPVTNWPGWQFIIRECQWKNIYIWNIEEGFSSITMREHIASSVRVSQCQSLFYVSVYLPSHL